MDEPVRVDRRPNITIIVCGDKDNEHFTYVENSKGDYYEFYTNGYEGNKADDIIEFMIFMGFNVFEANMTRDRFFEVVSNVDNGIHTITRF